ncbi:DUF2510 domain-containing protein [Kitasatospora camelliae]|uniref:DUF2510 domain-containing protein n=1 Tax=Kitasatospora camelliae TaxID=3156397 RepID=A0AAU8JSG3_9ACTN
MSNATPPGWYPVPGTADERWWDGAQWTAEVRPASDVPAQRIADAPTQGWAAATPPQPQPQHPQPPQPDYAPPGPYAPYQGPYAPGPSAGNRNGLAIGISAGVALVLVAAVIGGVLLARGKKDPVGPVIADPTWTTSAPVRSPSPTPSPRTSSSATVRPVENTTPDMVHGWRVPVPAGWQTRTSSTGSSAFLTSGSYECGMSAPCVRAQFSIEALNVPGTDAKSVAEAATAVYAPQVFGDLADHRELTSGPVAVSGAIGYAVRWYVTPKEGAKGYVTVVAVPAGAGTFTLLHGGADDDPQAPRPAVVDQIVAGIRPSSGSTT